MTQATEITDTPPQHTFQNLGNQYILQFPLYASPQSHYDVNQNIYMQLKIFEDIMSLNHNTTLKLVDVII